ncbi:hypothetical protein CK203_065739 [Vitis vinifera]|uniref:Uncharacterized protein n=1 Tax=Vitis vinifera TaxID=29760 RepID=A0A438G3C0_VITVI|nr:hypothetical protein CK203_065739 [Vitis vinifera]
MASLPGKCYFTVNTSAGAMERRLEEREKNQMQEVQATSQTPLQAMLCAICQSFEHLVEEYPIIPVARDMFGDCNTYNSSWRNHPNFSWKPRPSPYQPQAQTKHLNKPLQWSKPL